jgi:hypothetical protein
MRGRPGIFRKIFGKQKSFRIFLDRDFLEKISKNFKVFLGNSLKKISERFRQSEILKKSGPEKLTP